MSGFKNEIRACFKLKISLVSDHDESKSIRLAYVFTTQRSERYTHTHTEKRTAMWSISFKRELSRRRPPHITHHVHCCLLYFFFLTGNIIIDRYYMAEIICRRNTTIERSSEQTVATVDDNRLRLFAVFIRTWIPRTAHDTLLYGYNESTNYYRAVTWHCMLLYNIKSMISPYLLELSKNTI